MENLDLLYGQNWIEQLLTNHREHPISAYADYSMERLCYIGAYNIISHAQIYVRTPQGFERWAERSRMFRDMLRCGACDLIR